jgi:hypothetical protein
MTHHRWWAPATAGMTTMKRRDLSTRGRKGTWGRRRGTWGGAEAGEPLGQRIPEVGRRKSGLARVGERARLLEAGLEQGNICGHRLIELEANQRRSSGRREEWWRRPLGVRESGVGVGREKRWAFFLKCREKN